MRRFSSSTAKALQAHQRVAAFHVDPTLPGSAIIVSKSAYPSANVARSSFFCVRNASSCGLSCIALHPLQHSCQSCRRRDGSVRPCRHRRRSARAPWRQSPARRAVLQAGIARDTDFSTLIAGKRPRSAMARSSTMWPSRMPRTASAIGFVVIVAFDKNREQAGDGTVHPLLSPGPRAPAVAAVPRTPSACSLSKPAARRPTIRLRAVPWRNG